MDYVEEERRIDPSHSVLDCLHSRFEMPPTQGLAPPPPQTSGVMGGCYWYFFVIYLAARQGGGSCDSGAASSLFPPDIPVFCRRMVGYHPCIFVALMLCCFVA